MADGLAEARRLWASEEPADYRIDVRRLCFCGFDVTRAVRVTVHNGAVVSRRYVDDGMPASGAPDLFPDVAGLFEIVEDAIQRDAHRLDVRYDPALGFPLSIVIDYIEQAVDEELTLQVDAFEALTAPR